LEAQLHKQAPYDRWVNFDYTRGTQYFPEFVHVLEKIPGQSRTYPAIASYFVVQTLHLLLKHTGITMWCEIMRKFEPFFQHATYGEIHLLLQTARILFRIPISYWESIIDTWLKIYNDLSLHYAIAAISRIDWTKEYATSPPLCLKSENGFHHKEILEFAFGKNKEFLSTAYAITRRCKHQRANHKNCLVKSLNNHGLVTPRFLAIFQPFLGNELPPTNQQDQPLRCRSDLNCMTLFWCARMMVCTFHSNIDPTDFLMRRVLLWPPKLRGFFLKQEEEKVRMQQVCHGTRMKPEIAKIICSFCFC